MFDFYKEIRLNNNSKIKNSFKKLSNLYKSIPETKGCLENISKDLGCGGWCCQFQCPQLLYSEFLYLYDYLSQKLSNEDFLEILRKGMINSVDSNVTKGCIFFDINTKLCKCHDVRPYNCHIYGITPFEEFNPRYERLKEKYKYTLGAIIKQQCDLVSTVSGKKVTTKDTNRWWNRLKNIEKSIGIKEELITDEIGGSYRTPHDHLILYLMPDNVIMSLNGIRMYDNHNDKIRMVDSLINSIREIYGQ